MNKFDLAVLKAMRDLSNPPTKTVGGLQVRELTGTEDQCVFARALDLVRQRGITAATLRTVLFAALRLEKAGLLHKSGFFRGSYLVVVEDESDGGTPPE